jgi:hypothetical protein
MTVAEVLATRRETMDEPATVQGHLVVTGLFGYLARSEFDACGVLVNEPRLVARLLESAPVMSGSLVLFSGTATVEGLLLMPTGLPMFPASLYSVRAIVYRQGDRDPVRMEFP